MTTLLPILAIQDPQQSQPWLAAMPAQWPHQGDLLAWCQQMTPGVAALLIMLGIIYLLWGFPIFKALVLLNAAALGGYIGASLGQTGETAVAATLICAVFAAAIAWPTMKYAVALMGGVFGALLGASIWHTVNLDPHLVWAGAFCGLIAFGLLSFVLFRGSVMMYTSLQGSFMLVFGILGLLDKYQDISLKVTTHLQLHTFLLPAAVLIPALIGLIFQQHNTTHSNAHAGASGGGSGGGKK